MPINQTQPLQLEITAVNIDILNQLINLQLSNGYTNASGVFEAFDSFPIQIPSTEVPIILSTSGVTGTSIFQTAKTTLYDYILAQGLASGTIV
jgi:hypothetical protein